MLDTGLMLSAARSFQVPTQRVGTRKTAPGVTFYDTLQGRGVGERGQRAKIGAFCDTLLGRQVSRDRRLEPECRSLPRLINQKACYAPMIDHHGNPFHFITDIEAS